MFEDTLQYRLEETMLPLASDVAPSAVISTVHLWRRAALCRRSRVDIVVAVDYSCTNGYIV